MVSAQWRLFRHTALVVLVCFSNAATASLSARIDHPQVQLGKPVIFSLVLHTGLSQPAKTATEIDIAGLRQFFYIDDKETRQRQQDNGDQLWTWRLYPYATGRWQIPAIQVGTERSLPVPVEVIDAIDPKTQHRIQVEHMLSTRRPWARQQFTLITRLTTQADLRRFTQSRPQIPRLDFLPLDTVTEQQAQTYQYTSALVITAHSAGRYNLNLPPLSVIRDGVVTHRFYSPPQEIDVRPLPVYLPATVPVAKLRLVSMPENVFAFTDHLRRLNFKLEAVGNADLNTLALDSRLKNTQSLRFYPATISTQRNKAATSEGVSQYISVSVPYKANQQGRLPVAGWQLSYFDPQDSQLHKLDIRMPAVYAVNVWLFSIVVLLVALFAGYLFYRLGVRVYCFIQRLRYIRQARQLLIAARSPQQLRQAMRHALSAHELMDNLTPAQWLRIFSKNNQPAVQQSLQRLLYTSADPDEKGVHDIGQQLADIYASASVVFRWRQLNASTIQPS